MDLLAWSHAALAPQQSVDHFLQLDLHFSIVFAVLFLAASVFVEFTKNPRNALRGEFLLALLAG